MYTKKDYSHLKGMPGFSDEALDLHFKLYGGYVDNTNKLLETLDSYLKKGKADTAEYAEMKRRLGWEFDGMRLHEYYFGALGGNGEPDMNGNLVKALQENFGDFETWKTDFVSTAKIRGIGWAALYRDGANGRLMNFWINEHNESHPAGLDPILVVDVFEHAYCPDYKTDRGGYIEAFFRNIDWSKVEKRFEK